jgi:hypothetical protein
VHHGAPHPPGLGARDHSVDGHCAGHSPAMHLQCHHPRLWLRRSIAVCSAMVALLGLAIAQTDPLLPGPSFGTGLAGIPICQQPRVVLNYTLSSGANHGVLHHFVCDPSPFSLACPPARPYREHVLARRTALGWFSPPHAPATTQCHLATVVCEPCMWQVPSCGRGRCARCQTEQPGGSHIHPPSR